MSGSTQQSARPRGLLGLVVLVTLASFGLAASGLGGLLIFSGLFVLVVGVVALLRGRVRWARLGSRAAGAGAMIASLVLVGVGGAVAGDPAGEGPSASPESVTPSPSTTPTPTPTPTASATPRRAGRGTALAAVDRLRVGGRGALTGYDRELFGQAWFDTDRNGCDTRNDVLRRDLTGREMKNDCKVLAGTLAPDPYTGADIRFEYGGTSEVDVDHLVALSDAWQKGAAQWQAGKRLAFANDPLNLLAVDAGTNRGKGDGDTATWLPPNKAFRCTYVARQVAVKRRYDVRVTAAERDAMVRVLNGCADTALPRPGSAPTVAALPRSRATPSTSPQPRIRQFAKTPRAPAPAVVHPGSFCAQGAAGVTEKGTPMMCSTKPGDDRARWRSS